MKDLSKKRNLYFDVTEVWKSLCEEHTELLDKTFEEYALMLASDIDKLDLILEEKKYIIAKINILEKKRAVQISEVAQVFNKEISNVSELLLVLDNFEKENNHKHLFRFNALLIDLIEKIQDQGKKNQLFINKAIHSLNTIREETLGIKNYSTYNNTGNSVKNRDSA